MTSCWHSGKEIEQLLMCNEVASWKLDSVRENNMVAPAKQETPHQ
jgi:hypothetical protein